MCNGVFLSTGRCVGGLVFELVEMDFRRPGFPLSDKGREHYEN